MMDWTLSPVFGSYALVLATALGLGFILFAIRDASTLKPTQRAILWGLRLFVALLLLLMLLKPGFTWTRQREPRGTIAVMMDVSTSMQLSSGDGQSTRWESQLEIWNALWNARSQFGSETILAPFTYDGKAQGLGELASNSEENAKPTLPPKPLGGTTDIGGPLNQVATTTFSSPLTSVIWMGDGAQTESPAKIDPQQVARQLGRLDIPLFLIGIGPRGDNEMAKDLAIDGVPEQLDVYTKNQIYVRGMLKARGVTNRDIVIGLSMVGPDGVARPVEQTTVRSVKSDQSVAFQIPLIAPDAGSYELIVKAEPVDGEAVTENNEATAYLNVRGGGARVLYIEGEPRTEARFIANALLESPDMQVDRLWIAREPVQKWPVDLSSRLSNGVYDLFILGDLDSDAIGPAGAKLIADQVNKGAGLITLGGYFAYSAGGWDKTPLADILPVMMGAGVRQRRDAPIDLRSQYPGAIRLIPRTTDKLLQIGDPGADFNKSWAEMKPLTGASRWDGIKNAPGVNLMASGDAGQPLMVTGVAEKGRVLCLAFDSTFQWLRQGKGKEFKQFWRQLALWGLRREQVEEGMQLTMSQRRLFLNQPSDVLMTWNPGSSSVEMPKSIFVHLWRLGDPNNPKGASAEEDLGEVAWGRRDATSMKHRFEGVSQAGRYEWRAKAIGSKGQQIEARLPFIVMDRSIETMQPMPDWQLLSQLAKLNESAGGELVAPEQSDGIIQRILERRRQATETAIESYRLGDSTIDSWLVFLGLAALLISQWGLRKMWGVP